MAPASTWRTGKDESSAKTEEHNSHYDTINGLAKKYDVTEAQLLLRWAIQHDYCILPKSSKIERIEQNTKLFHFTIDDADMATLDGLDQNLALAWPIGNPLNF